MPCWEVNTYNVEFKAENRDILELALQELGWRYRTTGNTIRIDGGISIDLGAEKATYRGSSDRGFADKLNELRRAYSREVIKAAAKLNHWSTRFQDESTCYLTKRN